MFSINMVHFLINCSNFVALKSWYFCFQKLIFLGLTYVLGFGSLWGALRIGDILPWDIDIDLCE